LLAGQRFFITNFANSCHGWLPRVSGYIGSGQ
jgi:hypothetical protein